MPTQGIVTIVFGKAFQEEAGKLIRSVRQHCPGLPVCAITDQPWTCGTVPDEVLVRQLAPALEGSIYGWKAQFLYSEAPFERSLFLDPDIIVCQDLTPIFGLLDHYDIGFRFCGPPLRESASLMYHPKCHGGVILFKKCPPVESFFRAHLELFRSRVAKARAEGKSPRIDDERTYAIALAQSQARPVHLDNYLSLHIGEMQALYHPPLLYHGRLEEIESLHHRLVADWSDVQEDVEQRLWLPRIQGFLRPMSARWRDPLLFGYLVIRKLLNWARRVRLHRKDQSR